MQTQVNNSTEAEIQHSPEKGMLGRDAWDEDLANNDETCRRTLQGPRPKFSLTPEERKIETRDDLSFTGRILLPHRVERMNNWMPARLPDQVRRWELERAMGFAMMGEVMRLRQFDEHAAHEAVRFSVESENWRPGGHGVESGFAYAFAALAITGMRALEQGFELYQPL